jgi:phosphatidylserine/phosphatidylglycerophosphate/cardiolipin synthase-like enzyme
VTGDWSDLFRTATSQSWGSKGSRVTFGSQVVTDLADGLMEYSHAARRPVVLGCVYLFDSPAVADALCKQNAVCVVTNKTDWTSPAMRNLRKRATPVLHRYLPGFDLVVPRVEGKRAILGPHDFPLDDYEVGPVRVAGWHGDKSALLHAKVAVCCEAWTGEDDFGVERSGIRAIRAWVGSANWTKRSLAHAEVGVWIDDAGFAEAALDFVLELIRDSEPFGSHEPDPTPDLAEADLDDDEFAEYAAEFLDPDDPDDF